MTNQPHGSATSQGPGWWLASDNRWYPPHLRAGSPSATAGTSTNPVQLPVDQPRQPAASAQPSSLIATPTYSSPDPSRPSPLASTPAGKPDERGPLRTSAPLTAPDALRATTPTPLPSANTGSAAIGLPGVTDRGTTPAAVAPANIPAGTLAVLAGLVSMLGSFMEWATDKGISVEGFTLVRRIAAFDSNGWLTLFLGALLVVVGVMLLFGIRPMPLWSVLSLLLGIVILICVAWSYTDIVGQASDDWASFVARSTGLPDASIEALEIGLKASAGLWITGIGGLLGVLTAPFARRDQ